MRTTSNETVDSPNKISDPDGAFAVVVHDFGESMGKMVAEGGRNYVKNNPGKSIAIAATAGAALAGLIVYAVSRPNKR